MKGREVICEECRDQDIYDAINMLVSPSHARGVVARLRWSVQEDWRRFRS
jgi:hypothetical protein